VFEEAGEEAIRFVVACTVLGLEYLHTQKIAYMDLKPENLLVFSDGYVKLTDFGLSAELECAEVLRSKKRAGTPSYCAP
jgi:serine/threonine protein kinase